MIPTTFLPDVKAPVEPRDGPREEGDKLKDQGALIELVRVKQDKVFQQVGAMHLLVMVVPMIESQQLEKVVARIIFQVSRTQVCDLLMILFWQGCDYTCRHKLKEVVVGLGKPEGRSEGIKEGLIRGTVLVRDQKVVWLLEGIVPEKGEEFIDHFT